MQVLDLSHIPPEARQKALQFRSLLREAGREQDEEIRANDGKVPDYPPLPEPTPTELFHRRSIAISDESRVDGDSSGE